MYVNGKDRERLNVSEGERTRVRMRERGGGERLNVKGGERTSVRMREREGAREIECVCVSERERQDTWISEKMAL